MLALPSMVMVNVRSVSHKMDKLAVLIQYLWENQSTNMLSTETWLKELMLDINATLEEFYLLDKGERYTVYGADR